MNRPYPITACSLLSPLGSTWEHHRERLFNGATGLRQTAPGCSVPTFLGAVETALPPLPDWLSDYDTRAGRMVAFLLEGIRPQLDQALDRWGSCRIAVFLGSCNAGTACTESAFLHRRRTGAWPEGYDFHRQHDYHGMLHVIQRLSGCAGPRSVVSTACSSSAKVFASAQRLLDADVVDAAIVGGVDTLCQLTLHGFASLGLVDKGLCQPFGQRRAGLNLGEGGALMLIEREGQARTGLIAAGESSDAYHMTSPSPDGAGAVLAMRRALDRAQLRPLDVDFVQSHGTGTVLNDAAEGAAINEVFPEGIPVVASKSYTGHLLGACGAIEAAFALISLEGGWLPDSLLAGPIDPSIPIELTRQRMDCRCRISLSNSFGFGGSNISLVLGAIS